MNIYYCTFWPVISHQTDKRPFIFIFLKGHALLQDFELSFSIVCLMNFFDGHMNIFMAWQVELLLVNVSIYLSYKVYSN